MLARAHQHDGYRHVLLRQRRRLKAHERRQRLEAVFLAAGFVERRIGAHVARHFGLREPEHAFHCRQGQCVIFLFGAHHERVTDRKRERQADRKAGTLACLRLHVQRAAQAFDFGCDHIHSDAAACLLRDESGGREAGLENELHRILIAQGLLGGDEAERDAFVADRAQIHAAAIVREPHQHFGALAPQFEFDAADFRFAARHALLRGLDAVHDGVAQHVFERRQHALEDLPVELSGCALHDELGALAAIGCRLPHDAGEALRETGLENFNIDLIAGLPGEALHMALERHHARAHQAVLQLRDRARLLGQKIGRILRQGLKELLDARDIARRLGECARELLDRRVTVELERIEIAPMRDAALLVTVKNLRLGLDLKLAQLLLQACHRARQLA